METYSLSMHVKYTVNVDNPTGIRASCIERDDRIQPKSFCLPQQYCIKMRCLNIIGVME